MPHNNTIFHQISKLINWSDFEKIVDNHKGNYRVRHFDMKKQFLTMLFAQFSQSNSLREIENALQSHHPKLYHIGLCPVKRSTLAEANANRPSAVYLEFFQQLLSGLTKGTKRHLKDVTRLIDATQFSLPQGKASWAKADENKAAVKLHIVFDPDADLPLFAEMTSALVNDITVGKSIHLEAGATYVFDLGYYSFEWWSKMNEKGCRFVTRLKSHTKPKIIEYLPVEKGTNILSDAIGRLNNRLSHNRKNPMADPIRILEVKISTGKILRIVSNDLDSPASEIAGLYKQRWEIELFFKWVKQNLKIKHFIGTSKAAIWTQILIALIAYLLVSKLKKMSHINFSKTEIMRLIRVHILEKSPLMSIFKPPKNKNRLQVIQFELNLTRQ